MTQRQSGMLKSKHIWHVHGVATYRIIYFYILLEYFNNSHTKKIVLVCETTIKIFQMNTKQIIFFNNLTSY